MSFIFPALTGADAFAGRRQSLLTSVHSSVAGALDYFLSCLFLVSSGKTVLYLLALQFGFMASIKLCANSNCVGSTKMASSDPDDICFKCRGSLHFCQLCETVNSSTIRSWRARTVSPESFRLSSPDAPASKRRKVQEGRGELTSATPPASISVLSLLRTSKSR